MLQRERYRPAIAHKNTVASFARSEPESETLTMVDPLAFTIAQAAAASASGKTVIYAAIKTGELPARKRGRRTLILAADLRAWLEKLPALELKPKQMEAPLPECRRPEGLNMSSPGFAPAGG